MSTASTLKPSFVSSLYERKSPYHWVKIAGLHAGTASFEQIDDRLVVSSHCNDEELIACESGLWDEKPSYRVSKPSGSLKEQVKALSEPFPGVRLSVAPREFSCIFIAAALYKRTDCEAVVRGWMKAIWKNWQCDPSAIAESRHIGRSYQLIDLIKTMRGLLKMGRLSEDVEEARRTLMSRWGRKSPMLPFYLRERTPWIVPCDVHLQRISIRPGWVDCGIGLPVKGLCLKYHCDECVDEYGPFLRYAIMRLFPGFGGWAPAYLFGSTTCRSANPRCRLCHPALKEHCCERPRS